MAESAISYTANGNINPMRFVKEVAGGEYLVVQAGANETVIGVSGTYTQSYDTVYHATAGHTCKVADPTEVPLLELGGLVSANDYLKSDADGKGVAGSTTISSHQEFGAVALRNGRSGEFIPVKVVKFMGVAGVSGT